MQSVYKRVGIYCIRNIITGERYVGKTTMNFGDRWDSHRSLLNSGKHSNRNLQQAWTSYGSDAFCFEVLHDLQPGENINTLEQSYISADRAAGISYNLADGGDIPYNLGRHLSDDTKRKIGDKNRAHMTGRKMSEETKRKMSESQKARIRTPEEIERQREATRKANKGRVMSEEAKELLRSINQQNPPGAKFSPDDVRLIRHLHELGETNVAIAHMFQTSPAYVGSIIARRRWSHIQ